MLRLRLCLLLRCKVHRHAGMRCLYGAAAAAAAACLQLRQPSMVREVPGAAVVVIAASLLLVVVVVVVLLLLLPGSWAGGSCSRLQRLLLAEGVLVPPRPRRQGQCGVVGPGNWLPGVRELHGGPILQHGDASSRWTGRQQDVETPKGGREGGREGEAGRQAGSHRAPQTGQDRAGGEAHTHTHI